MKNNIISAFGAFLCISALAYLNSFDESNLWLIPPFGASMVLVMAAHESPMAHPKNVLFGHIFPFVTRDGKMTPQQTVATKLTEKSKSFGECFILS